jgi:hypothetical protein
MMLSLSRWDGFETLDRGQGALGAGIDEDLGCGQLPLSSVAEGYAYSSGSGKGGLAADEFHVGICQSFFPAVAVAKNNVAFSLTDAAHVDGYGTHIDAVIAPPASQVGDARTGHHGFRGSATGIDTSTACLLALDHHGLLSRSDQNLGQWIATLPGADDDGVKVVRRTYIRAHVRSPPMSKTL